MKKILATILLSLTSASIFAATTQTHPTMILVHGALLTSNSWLPVKNYLQHQGYHVISIDMPGRAHDGVAPNAATLAAAVQKVCAAVNAQSQPVMVIGHSQAGAIITEATNTCGKNINALVYVAAVVPLSGEKPFALLSNQDSQNFDTIAPINTATGLAQPNLKAPIKKLFMNDATNDQAKLAIANMVPEPMVLSDEVLHYKQQGLDKVLKFYIKTSQDLIISPATQDKYTKRVNMNGVFTMNTGHSPFVSQPKALADKLAWINDSLSSE